MLERVDQITKPPIVGRYYLVPCVHVHAGADGCSGMLPGWWPVIGPEHEDAEIFNFPHQHTHYDLRFLTRPQIVNRGGFDDPSRVLSLPLTNYGELKPPEYQRRRCNREQPFWPVSAPGPRMLKLERVTQVRGPSALKTCRVCPHRGIPLASMPVVDGVITCPGHGLRWNAETGELIRTPGPIRLEKLVVIKPKRTAPLYVGRDYRGFGNPDCNLIHARHATRRSS